MMTDNEVNKYIHETIMGKCWHETRERTQEEREPIRGWFGKIKGFKHPAVFRNCIKCGEEISPISTSIGGGEFIITVLENYKYDYCCPDSPRRLLDDVVERVSWKTGSYAFLGQVFDQLYLEKPSSLSDIIVPKVARVCMDVWQQHETK